MCIATAAYGRNLSVIAVIAGALWRQTQRKEEVNDEDDNDTVKFGTTMGEMDGACPPQHKEEGRQGGMRRATITAGHKGAGGSD